jgi:hypothetical protein
MDIAPLSDVIFGGEKENKNKTNQKLGIVPCTSARRMIQKS